jgi:hypothetical protein
MRAMRAPNIGTVLAMLMVLAAVVSLPAAAGQAKIERVEILPESGGTFRFDVTVRHADTGWDHYADRWTVLAPDGRTVLGERVLLHPHEDEQPFTRSLGGVKIPASLREVLVRAHDKEHGWSEQVVRVAVPGR